MLVFEFKTYGKHPQFAAIDDAIRTVQFMLNVKQLDGNLPKIVNQSPSLIKRVLVD